MKILIADDDRITRALVKRVVGHAASRVLEAEDGREALVLIEREDPDLLIADLRMPVLDGFELIASVRGNPKHALIPILCLSSVSERQDIARLGAMGITEYVLKPPRATELLARFNRIVRKHAGWKGDRALRDPTGVASPLEMEALPSAIADADAISGPVSLAPPPPFADSTS